MTKTFEPINFSNGNPIKVNKATSAYIDDQWNLAVARLNDLISETGEISCNAEQAREGSLTFKLEYDARLKKIVYDFYNSIRLPVNRTELRASDTTCTHLANFYEQRLVDLAFGMTTVGVWLTANNAAWHFDTLYVPAAIIADLDLVDGRDQLFLDQDKLILEDANMAMMFKLTFGGAA